LPRIAIASGKGGVGKSMVSSNLAVALADYGYSVALVDADIEGATQSLLFGVEVVEGTTLHDYLAGKATEGDVVQQVANGVSAVFGSMQLDALMEPLELERLEKLTAWLAERHEYVLIDSPPGFERDILAAFAASDAVLIVLTPDVLSVTGALKTKKVARDEGRAVLGLVVNRSGQDHDIPKDELEALIGERVLVSIPDVPEVRDSVMAGSPMVLSLPKHAVSRAIKKLAKKVISQCKSLALVA